MIQTNNIVVVSDTHCGCRLGLCPPAGIKLDDGGKYKPSRLQRKLWAMWECFWDEYVPFATKGDPYVVVFNGDAIDGVHHNSTTQVSHNLEDQAEIAKSCLRQVVDRCNGNYYHIRGTEAHVGKSAVEEERLAKSLGALPNQEGQYARYDLWKRIGDDKLVHALHHIGTTGSQAYEATAVGKEIAEEFAEAGRWRNDPPDVVVRSHRHRFIKVAIPIGHKGKAGKQHTGEATAVVTPCWQGKQMALDTKLPTPTGWTTIGDVQVGDTLFDDTGQPCTVIGINPIDLRPESYEITFSNGQKAKVCSDHLWETRCSSSGYTTVKTTKRILESLTYGANKVHNHHVKMPQPLDIDSVDLPIDPYVLGCWLGDGDSDGGRMTGQDDDLMFYANEFESVGVATSICPQKERTTRMGIKGIKPILRKMNLLNNKHIPTKYLRSSIAQRLSLLQGLMDTDGTYTSRIMILTTTSPNIRNGVCELLATLGIKFKWSVKQTGYKPAFNIRFGMPLDLMKVFRLPRKLNKCHATTDLKTAPKCRWVSITNIEPIAPIPMRCIKVDSPSNLFLFGDTMLPTHNTPFVWKIPGGRLSTPQFGGLVIRYANDELFVRSKVWTVDRSRTE